MSSVVLRVKSKGNKVGAAVLSTLNKMGNPTELLKKINQKVHGISQKKVMVHLTLEGKQVVIKVAYPGDGQVLRSIPQSERTLGHINHKRKEYELEPISAAELQGVLRSIR